MAPARRWVLFAIALASLSAMSYAGVLLAFSVRVTPEMLEANHDLPSGGRAVLVRIADPSLVRTHATGSEGALLVAGDRGGSMFTASAQNTSMGRALVHVGAEGAPANVTLVNVPSRNGTSNLTLDAGALAGGRVGWIVMGSGEETPRFVQADRVLGQVARFASGSTLGLTFAAGLAGFLVPLVAIVATHRPSGRKGAAETVCAECGAPVGRGSEFCLRCGAYQRG